MKTAQRSFG